MRFFCLILFSLFIIIGCNTVPSTQSDTNTGVIKLFVISSPADTNTIKLLISGDGISGNQPMGLFIDSYTNNKTVSVPSGKKNILAQALNKQGKTIGSYKTEITVNKKETVKVELNILLSKENEQEVVKHSEPIPGAPSVSWFTPTSGQIGTTITIVGNNFDPVMNNNSVYFGNISANLTKANETSITCIVPFGAITGPIMVKTAKGVVTSNNIFFITNNINPQVNAAPAITGFNPSSGISGSTVVITGTNFDTIPSNNYVSFNGIPANVISSTSSTITVIVPPTFTPGPVMATTPLGITVSKDYFTNINEPKLEITPSSGKIGTTVIIKGINFDRINVNANIVKFNGILATISSITENGALVPVPQDAETGPVTVSTPTESAISNNSFIVIDTPTITTIVPASGDIDTQVTIIGTNFDNIPLNNTVKFNNIKADIISCTTNNIVTRVPTGAITGPITISIKDRTTKSKIDFNVLQDMPQITSFSPGQGTIGEIVSISGKNLADIRSVKFNNINANVINSSDTLITTKVPESATDGLITITTSKGTALSTNIFTIISGTPVISSFQPASAGIGYEVIIRGSNFSNNPAYNIVKFNGEFAKIINANTNEITVSVPFNAILGIITVTTPAGTASSSASFTVLSPIIHSLSPTSGCIGSKITINGQNFSPNINENQVKFNNITANITDLTVNKITVRVPEGVSYGLQPVTIINGNQLSSPVNFKVLQTGPVINEITPLNSSVNGIVTIKGSNFGENANENIVYVGNLYAEILSAQSTEITFKTPALSEGQYQVRVNLGGLSSASKPFNILGDAPVITKLSSTIGSIWSKVHITGQNFSPIASENVVKFGNVYAPPPIYSNTNELEVNVPLNAQTDNISVCIAGICSNLIPYQIVQTGTLLYTYNSTYFSSPESIACDKNGDLWATSYNNNYVIKFSTDGVQKGVWSQADPFFGGYRPRWVTIDKYNIAWITLYAYNRVIKILPNGIQFGPYNVQTTPWHIAYDKNEFIWVVHNNGVVTKLNLSASVVGIYTVGALPWGISFDRDGNAWVANSGSNTINKINISTGNVEGPYPVPNAPAGIAVDNNNYIWIACYTGAKVTQCNSNGVVMTSYAVGSGPREVVLDNFNNVWVSNYNSASIHKISPTGVVYGPYTVGTNPVGMAFDKDSNLWVVNSGSNSISKIAP